jgi:hypothetical protein
MPVARMNVIPIGLRSLGVGPAGPRVMRKLPLGDDGDDDDDDTLGTYTAQDLSSDVDYGTIETETGVVELGGNIPDAGPDYTSAIVTPSGDTLTSSGEILTPSQVSSASGATNSTATAISSATQGIQLLSSVAPRATPTTVGYGTAGSQSIAQVLAPLEASTIIPGIPNWAIGLGGLLVVGGLFSAFGKGKR